MPPLLTHTEAVALRELDLAGYAALDRLRGRDESDAVFLLRRIAAMPGDDFTREAFSDTVDASYVLEPGRDTPSRTAAQLRCAPLAWRHAPLQRDRPELRAEIARAPRAMRRLSLADGQALVDLARGAMASRERSLEAFSFADARDAWLVDDGDGLAFGFAGVVAARRHPIAATYGSLTLRNGVPIGYGQADLVGASAALSFNTFETFRGAEAGYTFARWLAALRWLLGARSFTLDPYQLGHDNDEAIESGAWWFYAKLGFGPRDAATLRLMRDERARSQRRARHRTPPETLRELAEHPLFFEFDPARPRPARLRSVRSACRSARRCRHAAAPTASAPSMNSMPRWRCAAQSAHGAAGPASNAKRGAVWRHCWRCSTCAAGAPTSAAACRNWPAPKAAAVSAITWRATTRTRGSTPRCCSGNTRTAADGSSIRGWRGY